MNSENEILRSAQDDIGENIFLQITKSLDKIFKASLMV